MLANTLLALAGPDQLPAAERLDAWLGLLVVAVAAPLAAWGMRRVRLSSSGLLAGLVVGLLLGPGVLGRLAPEVSLRLFHGPPAEAAAIAEAARERDALSAVAAQTSADGSEEAQRLEARLESALEAWREASAAHRVPLSAAAIALGGLVLLGGGAHRRARRSRGNAAEALVLAAWGCLVPVALVCLWMHENGRDLTSPPTLSLASIAAIAGWRVAGPERAIARIIGPDAARTAEIACAVMALASALLLAAALAQQVTWPWAVAGSLAVLALPLRLAVGRLPGLATVSERVALPIVGALAAVRIEPFFEFALLPSLAFYLIAEDGRWMAITFGDRIAAHRPWLGAMRMALLPLEAGPSMLVVAAIALALGTISPTFGAAALFAAAVFELIGPLRYRVALQLGEIERQASTDGL